MASCSGDDEAPRDDEAPDVSVLLPVYNAMPWLPLAVLSCLRQHGLAVELLAVDDGATDGSADFLLELEEILSRGRRACSGTARKRERTPAETEALVAARRRLNPALQQAPRQLTQTNAAALYIGGAAGDATAAAAGAAAGDAVELPEPLSAADVAAACADCRCSLVVLHSGGRGQGAALNLALGAARGKLICEMEADDEAPADRLARLRDALEAHPQWDCATSQTELIGAERPGMRRRPLG